MYLADNLESWDDSALHAHTQLSIVQKLDISLLSKKYFNRVTNANIFKCSRCYLKVTYLKCCLPVIPDRFPPF